MTELLDTIANIAEGFTNAWTALHDRVPSTSDLADRFRVTGTITALAPRRDPEVLAVYLRAQLAVRHAYHRIVATGAPAFWPSVRGHDPDHPVDPLVLTAVLAGIRRHEHLIDDNASADLAAACKVLRPFWRELYQPPTPKVCRSCQRRRAARGRRDCWACVNARKRQRQTA